MSQIFHRSANISKVGIFGVLSLVGGLLLLAIVIGLSPYATKQGLFVEQPLAELNNRPRTTCLALVRNPISRRRTSLSSIMVISRCTIL
jgi:hypothetical protein